MLGDKKLMAFIVTADADKARDFYQNILGLTLIEEHEFAIVFDAFGIELRLQKAATHQPLPQTALGWAVPDIRGTVAGLRLVLNWSAMREWGRTNLGFGNRRKVCKSVGSGIRTATCCR